AQKVKNKRYNDTDEQASGYRKVKGESFSLNVDISRQMTEPGNFSAERNKHPEYDQNQSDVNQAFSEARHFCFCSTRTALPVVMASVTSLKTESVSVTLHFDQR